MTLLIAGLAIFFVAHFFTAFRSRAPGRDIKDRLGEATYMGLYSLVSGVGLGLMIYGYMRASPTGNIYVGPLWANYAAIALMLLSFILLMAAYVPKTHLAKLVKHPMLSAVILWSAAHLLIGANQQKLLLFGSFLVFGIVDFIAASSRPDSIEQTTQASISNDFVAIAIGSAVFAALLLWGHEAIFRVPIIL